MNPQTVEGNRPEQLGLALVSIATALILPILAAILWSTVKIDVSTTGDVVQSYAISAVVLFILLIFLAPLTTLFSIITGVLAYKRSRKIARYGAIVSFLISAVGVVLVMLLVQHIQNPPAAV